MMTHANIVELITEYSIRYNKYHGNIALVGSSSPLNKWAPSKSTDIDVIFIGCEVGIDEFILHLSKKLDKEWAIVNTWGIVSPAWLGRPAIHIHSTNSVDYCNASSLFRRSVSKYPSLKGNLLSSFAPKTPISRDELLTDRLGVISLAERLQGNWFSGFALDVDEPQSYSSQFDVSIYCVLHSVRNTLRWLGEYQEFSNVDALVSMWDSVGGNNTDILDSFVRRKRARRNWETFSSKQEYFATTEAHHFLISLAKWIREFKLV